MSESDRPTDPDAIPFQFPPPASVPDSLLAEARAASTEPVSTETGALLRAILGKLGEISAQLATVAQVAEAGAGTAANALSVAKATFEGLMALDNSFQEYRLNAMQQWDRDGAKREEQIAELRQSVTDIQEGRAVVAGGE